LLTPRAAEASAVQVAERIQVVLEAAGFGDLQITGIQVGDREYFVIRGDVRFVLGCGSFHLRRGRFAVHGHGGALRSSAGLNTQGAGPK
jgi:hypothetical protein